MGTYMVQCFLVGCLPSVPATIHESCSHLFSLGSLETANRGPCGRMRRLVPSVIHTLIFMALSVEKNEITHECNFNALSSIHTTYEPY